MCGSFRALSISFLVFLVDQLEVINCKNCVPRDGRLEMGDKIRRLVKKYSADLVPNIVTFDGLNFWPKNKFYVRIFWHLFFSMIINLTGLFFLGGNLPFFSSKIAETTSVSARTLPFSFSLFFFLFFFFLLFFFLRKSPLS